MRKVAFIILLSIPFCGYGQNEFPQEVELTQELKQYLDEFTYPVVLFRYGTIVPLTEEKEDPGKFAVEELRKSVENEFGLDFSAKSYNPLNLNGTIVFDYQDIRNYVASENRIAAMEYALRYRKRDAENPEILYISRK